MFSVELLVANALFADISALDEVVCSSRSYLEKNDQTFVEPPPEKEWWHVGRIHDLYLYASPNNSNQELVVRHLARGHILVPCPEIRSDLLHLVPLYEVLVKSASSLKSDKTSFDWNHLLDDASPRSGDNLSSFNWNWFSVTIKEALYPSACQTFFHPSIMICHDLIDRLIPISRLAEFQASSEFAITSEDVKPEGTGD